MLFQNRKTIGVFTNKADEHFRQSLFAGLTREAKKYDFDLAVFTTFGNHNSNSIYDEQEKAIVDLAPLEKLDGIIIVPDSYDVEELRERLYEKIDKYAVCPVVSVRTPTAKYYNVLTNEKIALSGIIDHMVLKHGFKRICLMAGYPGHQDSENRIACFKRDMEKYHLPIRKNTIFYADMWMDKGPEAVDFFYSNPDNIPEAIICANDYMAVALANELTKRGIRIPEDVCISGYDGIKEADLYVPQITTVLVDFQKMGESAVDIIYHVLNGEEVSQNTYLTPDYLFRGSCGCGFGPSIEEERQEKFRLFEQQNRTNYSQLRQTYFSINMGNCNNLVEIHTEVSNSINMLSGYRDFLLFLCKGDYSHLTSDVILTLDFRNQVDYGIKEEVFRRRELIPVDLQRDEPMAYFFMLLHSGNNIFGYTAVTFYEEKSFDYSYYNWMITISIALNESYNRRCLHKLIRENEEKSVKDYLTGLYNRRGFEMITRERFSGLIGDDRYMALIEMDLDGLKGINDTYGHGAGDFAIISIASAINRVPDVATVAARTGGDEFLIAFTAESHDDILSFIRVFEAQLRKINEEADVPYLISASIGYYFTRVTQDTSYEECLHLCDMCLYAEKKEHHKLIREDE